MNPGLLAVVVIAVYLVLLLLLGLVSSRFFKGTSADFFLASRGIGSFLLLMSIFGTTMTGFALVGSTGEAFHADIGVYGQMASWSGIIHSACFFLVGIKLWSYGKRYGYVTQIQFFRDRFESDKLGLVLFPVLVGLVIPYLLVGVISAGAVTLGITRGAFPNSFAATGGGVPFWIGSGVICLVVLVYVFFGGIRGTVWANTFQTIVFVALGVVTFWIIADKLGGPVHATAMVQEYNPTKLKRAATEADTGHYEEKLAEWNQDPQKAVVKPMKPHGISQIEFFTYLLVPLSVGMFPHLFQNWLTAKSAKAFRLSVIAHPILIMVVWVPCILIGVWATSAVVNGQPVIPPDTNQNVVLGMMVKKLAHPILGGFLTAGILAAIMSSLDSQFLCLGSIFTNDIVAHYISHDRLTDRAKVLWGRGFVVVVVLATYVTAIKLAQTRGVFQLGVWCFSGFASLFPLVFASCYWKRTTKAGAYACVLSAAACWLWLFARSDFGKNEEFLFLSMMPVVTLVGVSTLSLVLVSLVTPAPSAATIAKFFGRPDAAAFATAGSPAVEWAGA